MRVGGRVANGKEAGKLVSFGGVDFLFHVLGFLFYGDVQCTGKPFGGCRQQDVFNGRPNGGKIVERAETFWSE